MNKFIGILILVGVWKGYEFLNERHILQLLQEYSVYQELADESSKIQEDQTLTKEDREIFDEAIEELADRTEDIEPSVQRIYNNISIYKHHMFPRNSWYNKKECDDYIDDEIDSDISNAIYVSDSAPPLYIIEFIANKTKGA